MNTENARGKVVAFMTRERAGKIELLLIAHPYAGNQFPAGTVEDNEDAHDAALRELAEETGLTNVRLKKYIGYQDEALPEQTFGIVHKTKVYARPDATSFDWAEIRRGIWVRAERAQDDWTQITYEETDQYPNPNYVTYRITGWIPNDAITSQVRRHLFHLVSDDTRDTWTQFSDNHNFRLFWSPLDALAEIVEPQRLWLEYVQNNLNYTFR